jgi:deoxyribodipyrimidine photolyase
MNIIMQLKGCANKRFINVCMAFKKHDKSVFKLHPTSPPISTKDVKEALMKTSKMTPYNRLKYFHNKGIHYSQSIKYLEIVERLQLLYNCDQVIETNIDNEAKYTVSTTKNIPLFGDSHKMTIQEMKEYVDELLKDYEAEE